MTKRSWLVRTTQLCAVITLLCATLLCAHLLGQQTQAPAATFKARTELVLVPTIVTGAHGEHVWGLKKGDFTVLEAGKEQKLAVFEEVVTSTERARWAPETNNEFSNYLIHGERPARLTIVLLDLDNAWYDIEYARWRIMKYLPTLAEKGEPIALLTFQGGRLHVVHDFTTDTKVLVAALQKMHHRNYEPLAAPNPGADTSRSQQLDPSDPRANSELMDSESPDHDRERAQKGVQKRLQQVSPVDEELEKLNDQLPKVRNNPYALREKQRTREQALEEIAQAYGGLPGRKALVWISNDFPAVFRGATGEMSDYLFSEESERRKRTWQLVNDAQIAIYPVSMAGLIAPTGGGDKQWNSAYEWKGPFGRGFFGYYNLIDLARQTGGRAFYGRNDLEVGAVQAMKDFTHYYVLGYYLDKKNVPGSWRSLTVTVRDPRLKVRARSGFFVRGEYTDSDKDLGEKFQLAATSPLSFTALPFRSRVAQISEQSPSGKKLVAFQVSVPSESVMVDESDGNHMLLDVFVTASANSEKGNLDPGAKLGKTLESRFSTELLKKFRRGGINYSSEFELAPGDYTFRFVVRDGLTGKMGSIIAPFKVE